MCESNRLANVTARGLHVRIQLFAEFIECVASHNWRYHVSDRVFCALQGFDLILAGSVVQIMGSLGFCFMGVAGVVVLAIAGLLTAT